MTKYVKEWGYKVCAGPPCELRFTRRGLRRHKSACPGVAFLYQKDLQLFPLAPVTEGARKYIDSGRLLLVTCVTQSGSIILCNMYAPSGANAREERLAFFSAVAFEFQSLGFPRCVLMGDWNQHPESTGLFGTLQTRGFYMPLHLDEREDEALFTYQCGLCNSLIDSLVLSPLAFPTIQTQCVRSVGRLMHSLVFVRVSLSSSFIGNPVTHPPRVVKSDPTPESPIHWPDVETQVLAEIDPIPTLRSHQTWDAQLRMDRAWAVFCDNYKRELLTCHSCVQGFDRSPSTGDNL
eukprot:6461179-Amphidinium_carterae.1